MKNLVVIVCPPEELLDKLKIEEEKLAVVVRGGDDAYYLQFLQAVHQSSFKIAHYFAVKRGSYLW